MTDKLWQVQLNLQGDQDIAGEILIAASDADTISFLRDQDDDPWDVVLICQSKPDMNRIDLAVKTLRTDFSMNISIPTVSIVPDINWLQKNWMDLKPLIIGRFWVYGTHVTDPVPSDKTGIQLDAGMAFGTGNHATTHGCIVLVEKYLSSNDMLKVADIGAGSGILAIAAAKINPKIKIIAVDNDPIAVTVMKENMIHNKVEKQVQCGLSDGYRSADIQKMAPFDLIMANILPNPLKAMAAEAAKALRPAGKIILSGLNLKHADEVIAAHEAVGLSYVDRLPVGDWVTLLMEKPNGADYG